MSDLDKNYMKTLFGLVKVPLYRQILDAIIIFCVLASGSYAFPQRLKVQNFQMFVQITIVVFLSKFAIYLGLNFLLRTICFIQDETDAFVDTKLLETIITYLIVLSPFIAILVAEFFIQGFQINGIITYISLSSLGLLLYTY